MSIRVFMLLESSANPSSYVAGLQYEQEFRRDPGFTLETAYRCDVGESTENDRIRHWARRARVPSLGRRWVDRRMSRQEEELVARARRADVVYAVKIPSLSLLRRIREGGGPPILFAHGDAFWLPLAKQEGWGDLEAILRFVDGVTCVNDFTAERVANWNSRVHIVPDCPQIEDFDAIRSEVAPRRDRVTLGWIGTPLTAGHLFRIFEPLERLFRDVPGLHLRLVGSAADYSNVPRFESVEWSARAAYSRQDMIREVVSFDIGLFPMFDCEDARARGVLKAAIYMAGGTLAICQRLGDLNGFFSDGVQGLLAGTEEEWYDKMRWAVEHPAERRAIAASGLVHARQLLNRRHCFDMLKQALHATVAAKQARPEACVS